MCWRKSVTILLQVERVSEEGLSPEVAAAELTNNDQLEQQLTPCLREAVNALLPRSSEHHQPRNTSPEPLFQLLCVWRSPTCGHISVERPPWRLPSSSARTATPHALHRVSRRKERQTELRESLLAATLHGWKDSLGKQSRRAVVNATQCRRGHFMALLAKKFAE